MKSFEEVGKILFNDRYWEGGNGGNYKAPYSNKTPKPYERCKNSKFLCGAIPEHVVMQDFDNAEAFECRLRIARALGESCVAIKSSGRGGHFYWFNRDRKIPKQSNGGKTLLTLEPVDYKPGIRVTGKGDVKKTIAAGCVSTSDGGLREIVYENIKEDGTLSEIPFYDLPMQSGVNHKFLGLKSGDGRNEGLLTFMLPMISAGYTYEQYMTVAKIINEYVFAEPLDNGCECQRKSEPSANQYLSHLCERILEPPQLLTPPPDTGTIIVSFPMEGKGQRWRATLGRPWGYGGSDTAWYCSFFTLMTCA